MESKAYQFWLFLSYDPARYNWSPRELKDWHLKTKREERRKLELSKNMLHNNVKRI